MGLLDGGIKSIVGNALQGVFLDFSIIKKTVTAGSDPWEPSITTETVTACKAIVTRFKYHEIDGERVKMEDRKIIILAEGLAVVPEIGDYIKGSTDSRRYQVVSPVTKDPAGATYVVQAR